MDKLMHFICGLIISAIAMLGYLKIDYNYKKAMTVGILAGTTAGIAKEVFDYYTGGTVEFLDLFSSVSGSLVVPVLVYYTNKED